MNTKAKQEMKENVDFLLTIIYGDKYVSPIKRKRISDFWLFCQATFWPSEQFTEKQVEEFKTLIAEYFKTTIDVNGKFKELIERAILVKRYLRRNEGRYIAKPADWLNPNFMFGLSGTRQWYDKMTERRKALSTHNQGVAKLAEAMLNYSRGLDDLNNDFVKWLLANNESELLYFYTNATVFMEERKPKQRFSFL